MIQKSHFDACLTLNFSIMETTNLNKEELMETTNLNKEELIIIRKALLAIVTIPWIEGDMNAVEIQNRFDYVYEDKSDKVLNQIRKIRDKIGLIIKQKEMDEYVTSKYDDVFGDV